MKSSNKYWIIVAGLLLASCSAPVADQKSPDADTAVLRLLAESPGHTVFSQQETVRFGETQQQDTIRMSGFIVPDERRTNRIAVRVGGRIEKLYVRYPYQYVRKGEKLLDLYSPELTTAVSEYLLLRAKDKSSTLTIQAHERLKLLGLSDNQIGAFEKDKEAPGVISLYSAYEGYVVPDGAEGKTMNSVTGNSANGMNGMNSSGGSATPGAANPSALFREGAYVASGQTIYSINDAKEVIALLSVSPAGRVSVNAGMPVSVTSELPGTQSFSGTVSLVEPALEAGQHFLYVRVILPNSNGELKYNSLVTATLGGSEAVKNRLPSSCVLDLGKRKIVWVKSKEIDHVSVFVPRVVAAGRESNGYTEIISGLNAGEEVAQDAGLLVDREGIIQTELK